MSNKRLVYSDMFEDDTLGMLPREARLLWVGLIVAMADDQGRMLDSTALIRAKVFVYDTDVTNDMIEGWVQMLAEAGMVYRYTADNKNLLQIVNWWEYQKSGWANHSKYPAPDGWVDRVKIRNSKNQVDAVNWDNPGGFNETQTPAVSNTQTGVAVVQQQGVERGVERGVEQGVERGVNAVQVKVKEKVNVKEKVKGHEPFVEGIDKSYASVWETETGTLVTGFTAFHKMVDEFMEAGVTPELYRVAIREQKNSKYPVTNPTSVKNWALGLVNDTQGNNGKKPVKTRVYTYPDGSTEEVVING